MYVEEDCDSYSRKTFVYVLQEVVEPENTSSSESSDAEKSRGSEESETSTD